MHGYRVIGGEHIQALFQQQKRKEDHLSARRAERNTQRIYGIPDSVRSYSQSSTVNMCSTWSRWLGLLTESLHPIALLSDARELRVLGNRTPETSRGELLPSVTPPGPHHCHKVYWGLCTMHLLGTEDKMNPKEVTNYVLSCQHASGTCWARVLRG